MIEWGLIVKAVRYSGFRREAAYKILSPESAKKSGVLKAEKRGKWMYYRIGSPKITSLIETADGINLH